MRTLMQDLRFAARTLRKSPVFTTVSILSLALGIGANTAIFTLMDQVLLRALPVKNPQEIVMLDAPGANIGAFRNDKAFSYPMYRDFRDHNEVFSGVLARYGLNLSMTHKGQTERVDGELVSGNYFDVLGVQPLLGRTLTPGDDVTPGGHPIAVLTYSYWQRRFGGDPNILNETISLNGHPMTVVGVLPRGFRGVEVGYNAEVMVPIMMKRQMTPTWDDLENRRSMWLHLFARLKPGVASEQAAAGLNVLFKQILQREIAEIAGGSERFRKLFLDKNIRVIPAQTGRSRLRERFTTPLWVLMGMVGLVLLIACANVANLLIARAAGRQKEIAIRLALGAGRRQILRQLLSESLLLALIGGAGGILVAAWTGDFLLAFLPFESAMRSFSMAPDARVLAFNFGLALLAGILFGLAPALQATRPSLATTLKDEAGSVSAGTSAMRFRKTLVVAQIALSLLLLVGAGLFARSLYNLKSLDPGIRTENLISFRIDPSLSGYSQPRIQELFRRVQQNLNTLPGVGSASMATSSLMTDEERNWTTIRVEGYQPKQDETMNPVINQIGPDFFPTVGIPLVAGRDFTERDAMTAPRVAIINETTARYFFGGQSPIGKRLGPAQTKALNIEIVGLVRDDKTVSLRADAPRVVYFPYLQQGDPHADDFLRPHDAGSRSDRSSASASDPTDRFRSARVRVEIDGTPSESVSLHGASDCEPLGLLRPSCDDARRYRTLRSYGLHSGAANA